MVNGLDPGFILHPNGVVAFSITLSEYNDLCMLYDILKKPKDFTEDVIFLKETARINFKHLKTINRTINSSFKQSKVGFLMQTDEPGKKIALVFFKSLLRTQSKIFYYLKLLNFRLI